ncbi:unnamed protein product [Soboliphyme baturini]|uniref:Uncharacterized protein n=1 Tax=Soboliphyme baturini TaxID=241478 RepID=A0A183J0A9_9BILA|nr:unnamed protein product [Soboliphyme baturini]
MTTNSRSFHCSLYRKFLSLDLFATDTNHMEDESSLETVCLKPERPTFFIDLRGQTFGGDSMCNKEVEQLMKTKGECEQLLLDFTTRTINPVARQLLYRSDNKESEQGCNEALLPGGEVGQCFSEKNDGKMVTISPPHGDAIKQRLANYKLLTERTCC